MTGVLALPQVQIKNGMEIINRGGEEPLSLAAVEALLSPAPEDGRRTHLRLAFGPSSRWLHC